MGRVGAKQADGCVLCPRRVGFPRSFLFVVTPVLLSITSPQLACPSKKGVDEDKWNYFHTFEAAT